MDDQRKDHIDPEESNKRNRSKQLQTHNLPIDDVENSVKDLLLTNKTQIVPWGAQKLV